MFFCTPQIFLSCHQRRVLCSQSGDSLFPSHIYSGYLMWPCWSLWAASHWLHQAMVLSGMLGEGLGEAARLHHSCGAVTPLASPCAISNCPLSTFTVQFKWLWVHRDALGALCFQGNMKLLDTKIPWSGSIPCPRPCTAVPGWAEFLPCSCRNDAPAVEAWCLEHSASPCSGPDLSSSPTEMRVFLLESPAWVGWDCLRSWSWMRRETNVSKKKILPSSTQKFK